MTVSLDSDGPAFEGPDAPSPTRPARSGRRRWLVIAGIGLVVALVASTFAVVTALQNDDSTEVFLEAAARPGPNPFTPSVANDATPEPTTRFEPATARGAADGVPAIVGTEPGLYGGTRDDTACDPAQLVDHLDGNPAKARAWAGVLGIAPSDIAGYVNRLTAVVLRVDTRVTNHGFADGDATERQAVLQAGTAVLVDDRGIPRVRCSCGNPLTEPEAVQPTYSGTPWSEFTDASVVAVTPGEPTPTLTVTDLHNETATFETETGSPPVVAFELLRSPTPGPNGIVDVPIPVLRGSIFERANAAIRRPVEDDLGQMVSQYDQTAHDEYVAQYGESVSYLEGSVAAIGASARYFSVLWDLASMFSYSTSNTPFVLSVTVDLQTGEPVAFRDLFTSDADSRVEELVRDALYSHGAAEPDFFARTSYEELTGVGFAWAASPDALVLAWSGGMVAPEASGPVVIRFDWSTMASLLSDVGAALARIPAPIYETPGSGARQFLEDFLAAWRAGHDLAPFGPEAVIAEFQRDFPREAFEGASVVWTGGCEPDPRASCELLLDGSIVSAAYRSLGEGIGYSMERLSFAGDAG